jgi:hypothetical protein
VEIQPIRVACFQGLNGEMLLGDQGKNLFNAVVHFNLRLVCCDASSNALFDSEAKSIQIIFESI